MKGVSQIVLVLLILMIAITAITVLWSNFYDVFRKITSSGNTSKLGEALSTCMKIDSVSGNKIYLRNCGSGIITNSSLRVYLDEAYVNFSMVPQTIDKEGTGIITLYGSWDLNTGENHKIKITSPSAEVERFVKTFYSSHLFSDEILYLNFDEGSGNKTYDTSPYHNNGDINASGRNQVRNPSFEMDKQYWDSGGGGNWNIVTDEKYHGNKSSRFQSLIADGSSQCTGSVYIPVTQDEDIKISLYSKGENIVQGGSSEPWENAYLFGRWINSTGGEIHGLSDPYTEYADLTIGNGKGTWNWKRSISEAYQAPPGAVSHRFDMCLGWNATGTLWVDAVQVEDGDLTTDFRSSPWASQNSYDYVCSSADEYQDITVSCPDGKVIDSIENSVYTDENSPASCSNPTPSGFCPAASCPNPCVCTYPYENCIGKNSCSFNVNNGNCPSDPCYGHDKKLILKIKCKYLAESKFGNALEFDGVDDYINASHIPQIDNNVSFTISFWMYQYSNDPCEISIVKETGDWGNPNALFAVGTSGFWDGPPNRMMFEIWNASGNQNNYLGSSTLQNNVWYQLTYVFDKNNNKLRMYINGVLDNETSYNGGTPLASQPLTIGKGFGSCQGNFTGLIDDLRIWNRSLSQTEIQSIIPVSLTLGELT